MCLGLKIMIKYSRWGGGGGSGEPDVYEVNAKSKGGQPSQVSVRSAKPSLFGGCNIFLFEVVSALA